MVDSIKDTHLYEKPDAVLGYHGDEKQKDYRAIKASYTVQHADKDFKEAFNAVEKEIHDDYKPEYKEFEKFEKSYSGYQKAGVDPPKPGSYEPAKTQKKVAYKETKYEPPRLKPNKYGEIKDVPVKFKAPKYSPPKPFVSKYDAAKAAPRKYDPHEDNKDLIHDSDHYNEDGYVPPKYDSDHKYARPPKYESPPFEPSEKVYKPVSEDDREFDLFHNFNGGSSRAAGASYSDDTFGEYGVGYVEKSGSDKAAAPLKEEIHGSHYISEASKREY